MRVFNADCSQLSLTDHLQNATTEMEQPVFAYLLYPILINEKKVDYRSKEYRVTEKFIIEGHRSEEILTEMDHEECWLRHVERPKSQPTITPI